MKVVNALLMLALLGSPCRGETFFAPSPDFGNWWEVCNSYNYHDIDGDYFSASCEPGMFCINSKCATESDVWCNEHICSRKCTPKSLTHVAEHADMMFCLRKLDTTTTEELIEGFSQALDYGFTALLIFQAGQIVGSIVRAGARSLMSLFARSSMSLRTLTTEGEVAALITEAAEGHQFSNVAEALTETVGVKKYGVVGGDIYEKSVGGRVLSDYKQKVSDILGDLERSREAEMLDLRSTYAQKIEKARLTGGELEEKIQEELQIKLNTIREEYMADQKKIIDTFSNTHYSHFENLKQNFISKKKIDPSINGRRLLQNQTSPGAGTALIVALENIASLPDWVSEWFTNAMQLHTGKSLPRLEFPSRHDKKLRASRPPCGFVEMVPSNCTSSGGVTSLTPTYAHTACESIPYDQFVTLSIPAPVFECLPSTVATKKPQACKLSPRWDNYTSRNPRLGHPAEARQYKYVNTWIHPIEKQVIAHPYVSYGGQNPYYPSHDIGCNLACEAMFAAAKNRHNWMRMHPNAWYFSAGAVGKLGGIFSLETTNQLTLIIMQLETVLDASLGGEFIPHTKEFHPSSIRHPNRQCAEHELQRMSANNELRADYTQEEYDTLLKFDSTRDYCNREGAVINRDFLTPRLPSMESWLNNAFGMQKALSEIMDRVVGEFILLQFPSDDDWVLLSQISIRVMTLRTRLIDYTWKGAAKLQPLIRY